MVSIILVNYNGAVDTIACIESIKQSNNKDYRIIVVDNKSTDDSLTMLKKYQVEQEYILIETHENRGFSAGNNIGINKAIALGTDYIWLLNNDTVITQTTMDELLSAFSLFSTCGAAIGKILYESKRDTIWYAGGAISKTTARTEHWGYNEKDVKKTTEKSAITFATGCCFFMSVKAFQEVGLLNEDFFLYEEDIDYCIRFSEKKYKIIYCPEAIIYHRVSASTGGNSPTTQYYTVRNKYKIIQAHYKGLRKAIAYIYSTVQLLFRCFKGDLSFKYYGKGIIAFFKQERGKRIINLR